MIVVAGLSLKNLEPRVWDPASPFFLSDLRAVMVSYGEFHQMPARRRKAARLGLRKYLGVADEIDVYLDNGAFFFARSGIDGTERKYSQFVKKSRPDWRPIPRDYIPAPIMSPQMQRSCFDRTMDVNLRYRHDGFVPVLHIGKYLEQAAEVIATNEKLSGKSRIALGGIVPNLLRKPKALAYSDILASLLFVRKKFLEKSIHVFGVGGTATLHLAALIGFDSVDSSGWRNRAARGIVQLPGSGERLVADLGKWRGREPSTEEWGQLLKCRCPACQQFGFDGLKASALHGFCCRATHNLWILLRENQWLEKHISGNTYEQNYRRRLDNSTYRPIIREVLALRKKEAKRERSK